MTINTFAGIVLDNTRLTLLEHYHQLAADALQPILDGVPMTREAQHSLAMIAALAIEEAKQVCAGHADGGSAILERTPGITS